MKTKLFTAGIFAFFVILLFFPEEALEGSKNGLLLWFQTVLPTLLPFIILTNFITSLDAVHILCRFFAPLCGRLFHINSYGVYAMLTGFFCGYPMGAKIVSDLIRNNKITVSQGNYLLGICNNASPIFVISYVIIQTLDCPEHKTALLIIIYITPLIYAYFTRPALVFSDKPKNGNSPASQPHLTFQMVDSCIMNGFETITRLGGYIILFAIIAKMATARMHTVTIFNHLLIGFIEITNGICSIGSSSMSLTWKIPSAIAVTAFGGLSGLAQTKSMIQGTPLSMKKYICTKLSVTCLSTIAATVYCYLFIA